MVFATLSGSLSIFMYCQAWGIAGNKRRSPWQLSGHASRYNMAQASETCLRSTKKLTRDHCVEVVPRKKIERPILCNHCIEGYNSPRGNQVAAVDCEVAGGGRRLERISFVEVSCAKYLASRLHLPDESEGESSCSTAVVRPVTMLSRETL
jgi:hypothetical protein